MRVPPSIKPFLHKYPFLTIFLLIAFAIIHACKILGNFQDIIEGWGIMGDILNFAFNTQAGYFIFLLIGLLILWLAVKEHLKLAREYQPRSSKGAVTQTSVPTSTIGNYSDIACDLSTNNVKGRLVEASVPIQSVRFTKPKEKIVRPEHLPDFIDCEKSFLKRFRNSLLSLPKPRIIITHFTEKGIIWDEENTSGANIHIDFYSK